MGISTNHEKVASPALSRRDLLRGSIAGSLGILMPGTTSDLSASEPQESKQEGWIDAHSHIWSRDVERFPLAKGQTIDKLDPPSFTPEELFQVAHPVGVTRVVLIQHDIFHAFDISYLIHAAQTFPEAFRVVGKVDNNGSHPDRLMRELLGKQVTSFRITPRFLSPDKWLEGSGMAAMWTCAAETRQAMGCLIDAHHLPSVDAMCEKFPDTPVVIDHFARIGVDGVVRDSDVQHLCKLARHKYTYVKLSAYYALGKKRPPYDDLVPMIRRLFETYGPQRLMWASDAPYQLQKGNTYADSITLVRDRLNFLSQEDREWLLRKTAKNVYWL